MEMLGAASSVFAVVSLAVQLSSNIQKLIEFWDSVKEAPAEVAQIKSQLQILGTLLRSIEDDYAASSNDGSSELGIECLRVCAESIAKLEKLCRELDKGLNGSGIRRRWTCLRKAMKEKELIDCWAEIERAKSMLILYQGWRNGQRQASMLRLVKGLNLSNPGRIIDADSMQLLPPVDNLTQSLGSLSKFTKVLLHTSSHNTFLTFGNFRIRFFTYLVGEKSSPASAVDKQRGLKHRKVTITFSPHIISSSVREWSAAQCLGSWKIVFQTLNIRPEWSPIFEYAIRGDIPNVRRMLQEGLASPNDVTPDGWTVLHYAASNHHAQLCLMLIELGALAQCLTSRQQTPLTLAARKEEALCSSWNEKFRDSNSDASVNTIRVLVEKGKNDPMHVDWLRNTAVITAAREASNEGFSWLLKQDEYEIGLERTAAFVSTRPNLSSDVLQSLLQCNVKVNEPCAKFWHLRFGRKSPRLKGPSMLHCAVWEWYDQLLAQSDPGFPWSTPRSPNTSRKPNPGFAAPLDTFKILLDHGGGLYAKTESGHTILDGILLNIIQFNGSPRPAAVLADGLQTWLRVIKDLGFDVKEYIECEKEIHKGCSYDLGLGLLMKIHFPDVDCSGNQTNVCSNEYHYPGIRTYFWGPQERESGVCWDSISRCSIWPEWQRTYVLPEPPPRCVPRKYIPDNSEIVVLQGSGTSDEEYNLQTFQKPTKERPFQTIQVYRRARRCLDFFLKHPYELSFYMVFMTSLAGCGYFAKMWITATFFICLKVLCGFIS